MSPTEVGAAVVGAGIAGLAAALELQTEMSEVLVVDALDRAGGVARTDHVSRYSVERGPNTFQVKSHYKGKQPVSKAKGRTQMNRSGVRQSQINRPQGRRRR